MKKIMFSDLYGLTRAVLDGRKTQTRRLVPKRILDMVPGYQQEYQESAMEGISFDDALYNITHDERMAKPHFRVGEEVAIAQRYSECLRMVCLMDSSGWDNKMFTSALLLPHRIRITGVRIERLQDISYEDVLKEGICCEQHPKRLEYGYRDERHTFHELLHKSVPVYPHAPRSAYAALIDRISGKGTWDSNPYVFVYDFELLK